MQILTSKWFTRFARHERIPKATLRQAIERAESGLIDADLGGGLVKQRVARDGKGRSGGYRVIVAYRAKDRAVFLAGFAKNELDNISHDQLLELRKVGANWLNATAKEIERAVRDGILQEV